MRSADWLTMSVSGPVMTSEATGEGGGGGPVVESLGPAQAAATAARALPRDRPHLRAAVESARGVAMHALHIGGTMNLRPKVPPGRHQIVTIPSPARPTARRP